LAATPGIDKPRRSSPRRVKHITSKEVAAILKVNPEIITYLRISEDLPFKKNKKYIIYSEREVTRWRNRKLAENTTLVMNLLTYYTSVRLDRFCTYQAFKSTVADKVFLDGDNVVQYLKRQNPARDVQDVVGAIVSAFWDAQKPKCSGCGKTMLTTRKMCTRCLGTAIPAD